GQARREISDGSALITDGSALASDGSALASDGSALASDGSAEHFMYRFVRRHRAQDVFDASGAATDDGLQRLAAGRKAVFVVVIKHGQQPVAFALTEACTRALCPLRGIDAAGIDLAAQHPGGNPGYIA